MAGIKRAGRQRTQLPYCYYEGYLEKRSFKDKASRKLWSSLCGNTLFFYNNNRDSDYAEKLDLADFVSLTDDCSRDRNLEAARLNLHMKDGEIKLTAPSLEARELWKGFIYSVVELSVPDSLNLLPGQIQMMRETVTREKERLQDLLAPPAPASSPNHLLSLMPECYQAVSRSEAEMMLERNPGRGNLLLRPGRDGASFAVTTYQDLNGPVFRHYRVTRKHDGGFSIDVENPIPCATLHDVIDCLVEKTGRALTPFIMEGPYEESITFVQSNEENGERSLQCASSSPTPPASTPAPVLPPKPGPRRAPTYEPQLEVEDSLYLNEEQVKEKDMVVRPAPRLPMKPPLPQTSSLPKITEPERKAVLLPGMFPTPAPRSFPSTSSSSSSPCLPNATTETLESRMRRLTVTSVPADSLAQTVSEELRQKLVARRALQ